jgi:hypothetical protein
MTVSVAAFAHSRKRTDDLARKESLFPVGGRLPTVISRDTPLWQCLDHAAVMR